MRKRILLTVDDEEGARSAFEVNGSLKEPRTPIEATGVGVRTAGSAAGKRQ